MAFVLTSLAFENGGPIPREKIRDGDNLSPQLEWTQPPEGTESFVLIMEDPDAIAGILRRASVRPPTLKACDTLSTILATCIMTGLSRPKAIRRIAIVSGLLPWTSRHSIWAVSPMPVTCGRLR